MTKAGTGLLAVWMEPPPELDADLQRWYDEEHLPERLAIPGFLGAQRYECIRGEPKYLALYDLKDVGVLASDAYKKARDNATPWTRRTLQGVTRSLRREYELVLSAGDTPAAAAPFVLLIGLETAPEHEPEFNDWYNQEHIPALAAVPGVLRARRFRAREGSPRYLALYDYAEEGIRESPAWKTAAETPWTHKMRQHVTNRAEHLGRLINAV